MQQPVSTVDELQKEEALYAEFYLPNGDAYTEQGGYDETIADLTQMITLNPEDAIAYYSRGDAYREQKRFDKAIGDYTQVITLNPEDATAYYSRGDTYREQGRYSEAIRDYTQVITLNPNSADVYFCRGRAYEGQERYDEAIRDYTQAMQLYSEDAVRGYGNPEKKRAAFEALLRLNPAYFLAHCGSNSYTEKDTLLSHTKATDAAQSPPDDKSAESPVGGFLSNGHGVQSMPARITAFQSSAHHIINTYQGHLTMSRFSKQQIHIELPAMNDPHYDVPLFCSEALLQGTLQELNGYLSTALSQGLSYKVSGNRLTITTTSAEKADAVVKFLHAANCWFENDAADQQAKDTSKQGS